MGSDDLRKQEYALFRFSLIAPLVNGLIEESPADYIERIAAKAHALPGGGTREFTPATIRRWLQQYKRGGITALMRRERSDRGAPRRLTEEHMEVIREYREAYPGKRMTQVYSELVQKGLLKKPVPSQSTVCRYLRTLGPVLASPPVERRRFVMEHANDLWQADSCVGPYLVIGGKKRKTHLIAFLDDASRIIPHAMFFFEESAKNVITVLKEAIMRRGVPKKIFTDNGKIFRSLRLRFGCAALGIEAAFARPYSAPSKGKIERFFGTLRSGFMVGLDLSSIDSIDRLNELLWEFLEQKYHRSPHSSLDGRTPIDRYMADEAHMRFPTSPKEVHEAFLACVKRKVKGDATISIDNVAFEVPQKFIGKSLAIRYNPDDLSFADIVPEDKSDPVRVYPVRPRDNALIPRTQNKRAWIDYRKLYSGGEGDV